MSFFYFHLNFFLGEGLKIFKKLFGIHPVQLLEA